MLKAWCDGEERDDKREDVGRGSRRGKQSADVAMLRENLMGRLRLLTRRTCWRLNFVPLAGDSKDI